MKSIISTCLLSILASALVLSYADKKSLSPRCRPGSYNSQNGREPCVACPRGKHQIKLGKKKCRRCKKGYSTIVFGSRGKFSCTKCPKGLSKCAFCGPGYFGRNGISPCFPCEPGTASAGGESRCRSCDIFSGYITGGKGAQECMRCPKGAKPNVGDFCVLDISTCSSTDPDISANCRLCQPGTSSITRLEPCILCPRGMVSETFGAKRCMHCKFGTYTPWSGHRSLGLCEPAMASTA